MTGCFFVFAGERSKLSGGWRSAKYMPRTFSVGYFAAAQYDVKIPYRRLMPTLPPKEEAKKIVFVKIKLNLIFTQN